MFFTHETSHLVLSALAYSSAKAHKSVKYDENRQPNEFTAEFSHYVG